MAGYVLIALGILLAGLAAGVTIVLRSGLANQLKEQLELFRLGLLVVLAVLSLTTAMVLASQDDSAPEEELAGTTPGLRENVQPRKPLETVQDCVQCPRLVRVDSGSGVLGALSQANAGDVRDAPFRMVNMPAAYYIGQYEVTRGEFAVFVRETGHVPSNACDTGATRRGNFRDPGYPQTDDHPATCVSFTDAQAFVAWLSRKTGRPYRLPTESEWEFAARAGSSGNYASGKRIARWQANYTDMREAKPAGTLPVGSFEPNGFGLYDAHGNVWELVQGCWPDDHSDQRCAQRIAKGGSWKSPPGHVRAAVRTGRALDTADNATGFRVARD
jgi:formylglycine-generating enzyme required for sulfatase activity